MNKIEFFLLNNARKKRIIIKVYGIVFLNDTKNLKIKTIIIL